MGNRLTANQDRSHSLELGVLAGDCQSTRNWFKSLHGVGTCLLLEPGDVIWVLKLFSQLFFFIS